MFFEGAEELLSQYEYIRQCNVTEQKDTACSTEHNNVRLKSEKLQLNKIFGNIPSRCLT